MTEFYQPTIISHEDTPWNWESLEKEDIVILPIIDQTQVRNIVSNIILEYNQLKIFRYEPPRKVIPNEKYLDNIETANYTSYKESNYINYLFSILDDIYIGNDVENNVYKYLVSPDAVIDKFANEPQVEYRVMLERINNKYVRELITKTPISQYNTYSAETENFSEYLGILRQKNNFTVLISKEVPVNRLREYFMESVSRLSTEKQRYYLNKSVYDPKKPENPESQGYFPVYFIIFVLLLITLIAIGIVVYVLVKMFSMSYNSTVGYVLLSIVTVVLIIGMVMVIFARKLYILIIYALVVLLIIIAMTISIFVVDELENRYIYLIFPSVLLLALIIMVVAYIFVR